MRRSESPATAAKETGKKTKEKRPTEVEECNAILLFQR
jgi:hypothetical protein